MFGKLVKKIGLTAGTLGIAALVVSGGAKANVISENFNAVGKQDNAESITWDFINGGGSSTLDFELAGYSSLDGFNNNDTDIFHLFVNGLEVFTGSFNLGGGGSNAILFNPNGGSAQTTTFGATDDIYNSSQVTWAGGVTQISLPVYLLAGANQITFGYSGVAQGLDDEAWGINQATLTASVPEPATFALLLAGLFGLLLSRRKLGKK